MTYYQLLLNKLPKFELDIKEFLNKLDIPVTKYRIDHIGVRTNSVRSTQRLKDEIISDGGSIVAHPIINGREVSTLLLGDPILFLNQEIKLLELPEPVNGESCEDKFMWEHVEMVIPGNELTLDGVEKSFFNEFPLLSFEKLIELEISYSKKMNVGEFDRLPNPTIKLENKVGLEIKFHLTTLAEIIGLNN